MVTKSKVQTDALGADFAADYVAELKEEVEDLQIQNQRLTEILAQAQAETGSPNDTIDPRELDGTRYQPRKYLNPQAKAELEESILLKGISNPILVQTSRKAIIAGCTRHSIAIEQKFSSVPIRWLDVSDDEAADLAAIDNVKREDLSPIDETVMVLETLQRKLNFGSRSAVTAFLHQAVRTISNDQPQDEVGVASNVTGNLNLAHSAEAIIRQFTKGGISLVSFTTNRIKLLSLPTDVLEAVRQGDLDYTKSIEIAKIEDDTARQELLGRSIEEELSVRAIRAEVAKAKPPKVKTNNKNVVHSATTLEDTDTNNNIREDSLQEDPEGGESINFEQETSPDLESDFQEPVQNELKGHNHDSTIGSISIAAQNNMSELEFTLAEKLTTLTLAMQDLRGMAETDLIELSKLLDRAIEIIA
jgi:ParB family transcriptional regulator, chromosome partitioning protein